MLSSDTNAPQGATATASFPTPVPCGVVAVSFATVRSPATTGTAPPRSRSTRGQEDCAHFSLASPPAPANSGGSLKESPAFLSLLGFACSMARSSIQTRVLRSAAPSAIQVSSSDIITTKNSEA